MSSTRWWLLWRAQLIPDITLRLSAQVSYLGLRAHLHVMRVVLTFCSEQDRAQYCTLTHPSRTFLFPVYTIASLLVLLKFDSFAHLSTHSIFLMFCTFSYPFYQPSSFFILFSLSDCIHTCTYLSLK